MSQFIAEKTVKGRKDHQCFHCYRTIPKGTPHLRQTCAFDGRIYSLRFHIDCDQMHSKYVRDSGISHWDFDDEGYPPLWDMWADDGEVQSMCDLYRGYFPHAVARFEHNLSDAEDRRQARIQQVKP